MKTNSSLDTWEINNTLNDLCCYPYEEMSFDDDTPLTLLAPENIPLVPGNFIHDNVRKLIHELQLPHANVTRFKWRELKPLSKKKPKDTPKKNWLKKLKDLSNDVAKELQDEVLSQKNTTGEQRPMTEPLTRNETGSLFSINRNNVGTVLEMYYHEKVNSKFRFLLADMPPEYFLKRGLNRKDYL